MTQTPSAKPQKKRDPRLTMLLDGLKRIFIHNWPTKLLALLLAIILWGGLITQYPTLTREKHFSSVSVSVSGEESVKRNGFIVTSDLTSLLGDVSLTADVPQMQYANAKATNYNVRIDLSRISSAGEQEIRILSTNSSTYGTVSSIQPSTVTIDVEEYITRFRIPVSVQTVGSAPEGYYAGAATLDPPTVTISGPKSMVDKIVRAEVVLELNNLHKTFNPGTVNEKVALNGVSLHMEAGDFATIVGSNGAGKSTMFNAITGGFIADEGSIVLGGQDITFAPEYERSKVIGHLFQDPLKGTAPHMTIEENLALAYLRAGTAPNAIFSRISRKDKEIFREKLALLDMGLEDRMKQPVGLLSGGQRQALTLLMASLKQPKLLLLDEHTAALDPATAEKVLELTKSIVAEKKITCLMVTHNMHQALELGNRTLMMDAGRIVFDVKGEARSRMTVDDLLEKFRENAGKALDNDRILLSKVEKDN